ncbi:hypothetical protein H0H93_014933, partial [Arthromyces matolae]
MRLPVCVAASIALLWLSLPFAIPGCKALPLPTDQEDLPRTQQEWVDRIHLEEWKAAGQNPPNIESEWPNYDLTLFCGSPFDSNPGIHPGSPSGSPFAALNCEHFKRPVNAISDSPHRTAPPTTHQVASPIHGESYKDPNRSSSSTHTGESQPPGSQSPDTNPGQNMSKELNEKWLRYVSTHPKYATFWKEYQDNLQKKRKELSKEGGTEEELHQKLEQYQLRVFTRHRYEGRLRMEKLNGAIPIQRDKLKELEEWEQWGGDDQKDSKLQKAMKEEEAKIQAQAIALDPLKPTELNPEV